MSHSVKVNTKDVKGVTTEMQTIQNEYLTVTVPARFRLKNESKGAGRPLFLQQMFAAQIVSTESLVGDQLAITIGALDAQGIDGVSSLLLRRRDASYKQVTLTSDATVLAYENVTNSYEITAFIPHGSYYAVLSLTVSKAASNEAVEALRRSIDSLHWAL